MPFVWNGAEESADDDETGWSLRVVERFKGAKKMKLTRPDGATISFTLSVKSNEETFEKRRGPDGKEVLYRKLFVHLAPIRMGVPGVSGEQVRDLIDRSLTVWSKRGQWGSATNVVVYE